MDTPEHILIDEILPELRAIAERAQTAAGAAACDVTVMTRLVLVRVPDEIYDRMRGAPGAQAFPDHTLEWHDGNGCVVIWASTEQQKRWRKRVAATTPCPTCGHTQGHAHAPEVSPIAVAALDAAEAGANGSGRYMAASGAGAPRLAVCLVAGCAAPAVLSGRCAEHRAAASDAAEVA